MEILCYFGHHKCATQWISRVCHAMTSRRHLQFTYLDYFGPPEFHLSRHLSSEKTEFLAYANADPVQVATISSFKAFHVIRDPRDIVVSGYFSHKNSHHVEHWPELVPHRRRLNEVSIDAGLFLEMDFSRSLWMTKLEVGLLDSLADWDFEQENILEMKYENLIENPLAAFTRAFSFLNLLGSDEDRAHLQKAIDEYSFRNLSGGRQQGQEDQRSHFRKGVAGDWKEYFNDEHKARFKSEFGDLLIKLGYEKNLDW